MDVSAKAGIVATAEVSRSSITILRLFLSWSKARKEALALRGVSVVIFAETLRESSAVLKPVLDTQSLPIDVGM